jgi:hypothetical protein
MFSVILCIYSPIFSHFQRGSHRNRVQDAPVFACLPPVWPALTPRRLVRTSLDVSRCRAGGRCWVSLTLMYAGKEYTLDLADLDRLAFHNMKDDTQPAMRRVFDLKAVMDNATTVPPCRQNHVVRRLSGLSKGNSLQTTMCENVFIQALIILVARNVTLPSGKSSP